MAKVSGERQDGDGHSQGSGDQGVENGCRGHGRWSVVYRWDEDDHLRGFGGQGEENGCRSWAFDDQQEGIALPHLDRDYHLRGLCGQRVVNGCHSRGSDDQQVGSAMHASALPHSLVLSVR